MVVQFRQRGKKDEKLYEKEDLFEDKENVYLAEADV